MKVELVELYSGPVRRQKEDIRGGPVYRGELSMAPYFAWHGQRRPAMFAMLRPMQISELDKVQVLRMRGPDLVLGGEQSVGGKVHEQVWWCKLLPSAEGSACDAPAGGD